VDTHDCGRAIAMAKGETAGSEACSIKHAARTTRVGESIHPTNIHWANIMTKHRVPDIALINLGFLLALKEAVIRDPAQACYQFRLDTSDAAVIGNLDFDALESLALGLDESIVTLRYTGQDLCDLIKTPPALRNIFATVRELIEPTSIRQNPCAPMHGPIQGSC
jgi:hypothetical protein